MDEALPHRICPRSRGTRDLALAIHETLTVQTCVPTRAAVEGVETALTVEVVIACQTLEDVIRTSRTLHERSSRCYPPS